MNDTRQQYLDLVSTDKQVRQAAYEVFASTKEGRDVLEIVAKIIKAEIAYSKKKELSNPS